MESLYLLIPVALIFALIIGTLLIWAVNRGQYDDLDKDAWRALNDDLDAPEARDKSDTQDDREH
jgi:cbb3-type cytochrome oxidase maturation protein